MAKQQANIDEWMIVVGSLGMLILAIAIVLFVVIYNKRLLRQKHAMQERELQHRKEMIDAVIHTEQAERVRIARNIHDDMGAVLNTARLNLSALSAARTDEARYQELVNETNTLLQLTIDNIRNVAKDLMPPVLKQFGLSKALAELCRRSNVSAYVHMDFVQHGAPLSLTSRTEVQLYRIVQEIVNNALKHSGAKKLEIISNVTEKSVQIIVHHNGQGLAHEKVIELSHEQRGIGLNSILSRALIIGATVQYVVMNEQESRVIVEIPLHEAKN
ncbi:MAG: sensor histidine kinase [Flavobacteriales bacterium]